jgi:hypothetical protein
MATKTRPDPSAPKRPRKSVPKNFMARLHGVVYPILVVAKTKKIASETMLTLVEATAADLIEVGKKEFEIVDTLADPTQILIDDKQEAA